MNNRSAFDEYIAFNMFSEFERFLAEGDKDLVKTWLCACGTTTPLHIAAGQYPVGRHSMLKKLLAFASNYLPRVINVRDELGRTPLMITKGLYNTCRPRTFTADQMKNWKLVQRWADTNSTLLKQARKKSCLF
jgi:hypothetical protein